MTTDQGLLAAADLFLPADVEYVTRYRDNPSLWVAECIKWREGEDGASVYQAEILDKLVTNHRVAVRGPHGLGKTALASWALLWYSTTRDGEDWKVVTTASAWRQLTKFLWPEIRKWSRRLDWERLGRKPFVSSQELLALSLKLTTGEAFAVASDQPELIEGAHADNIFYIFDESKAIIDGTFDAAEGALSTGDAYALAISTPGEPQGRFYDIHRKAPGTEDWWVRHVTLTEAIAAERVDADWAEQRRIQWGEESAVYINRVLGEFASSEEFGVVPLPWVEEANRRWEEMRDDEKTPSFADMRPLKTVGVDLADSGEDDTVFALRVHNVITELRRYPTGTLMAHTGRVAGLLTRPDPDSVAEQKFQSRTDRAVAIVDVIGIGAGVVSRLKELGHKVFPFNAAEGTKRRDLTGELGFVNKRSAAWWNLREMLDPESEHNVALPPDDKLTGDLTAPQWKVTSGGKIQVESKDDIRKRLGRSTDAGDAVIQAFWPVGNSIFRWNPDPELEQVNPWKVT